MHHPRLPQPSPRSHLVLPGTQAHALLVVLLVTFLVLSPGTCSLRTMDPSAFLPSPSGVEVVLVVRSPMHHSPFPSFHPHPSRWVATEAVVVTVDRSL